jgi:hypothetical protein
MQVTNTRTWVKCCALMGKRKQANLGVVIWVQWLLDKALEIWHLLESGKHNEQIHSLTISLFISVVLRGIRCALTAASWTSLLVVVSCSAGWNTRGVRQLRAGKGGRRDWFLSQLETRWHQFTHLISTAAYRHNHEHFSTTYIWMVVSMIYWISEPVSAEVLDLEDEFRTETFIYLSRSKLFVEFSKILLIALLPPTTNTEVPARVASRRWGAKQILRTTPSHTV